MSAALNLYKKLPDGVRGALKYSYSLIPLQARLGKRFFKQLDFLEKSQWWSKAELENYQNEELRRLIRHAYENVPYYKKIFKDRKLTLKDIVTVKDLAKLPILTKDTVRNNLYYLRAQNFRDDEIVQLSTSGTTGKYLSFYYDKAKEYLNFDPFVWRLFGWAGHKVGEIRATFSEWTTSGELYEYNPVRNLLIFSIHKMNIDNVHEYASAMKRYRVEYMDGYPSIIELFTQYMRERDIERPVGVKAIFSHSECLYAWQRNTIEVFWSCKCFDWYGLEERVIMGLECEKHEGLHLCDDFGVTEFITYDTGNYQKIIATSLTNYAMPTIRYDTEDIGALSEKACCCGRAFPLLKLKGGRKRNFAIGKNGAYIPIDSVDIPSFTNNVRQFQFVQNTKGELTLNIVRKPAFTDVDTRNIESELSRKFGSTMSVAIQFVKIVEQTKNKKTPLFIQKMQNYEDR